MDNISGNNFDDVVFNLCNDQRYNFGIWIEENIGAFDIFCQSLSSKQRADLNIFSIETDLLKNVAQNDNVPLGVFGPKDLNKWVMHHVSKYCDSKVMVYTELDSLLGTWKKDVVKEFFSVAKSYFYPKPVVLISKVRQLISSSNFPKDRIWVIKQKGNQW